MIYLLPLMIATLVVLIIGLTFMTFGGKLNRKYGSMLMMLRVVLQGLTIGLMIILYMMRR